MAEAKPKRRRRKIPYIGPRRTASEIAANYPLPPEMDALVDRILDEIRAERTHGRRKPATSAKTARAK